MKQILFFLMLSISLLLSACSLLDARRQQSVSNSMVDYLYPERDAEYVLGQKDKVIPNIKLPVRIGLAFVPEKQEWKQSALSQQQQAELLAQVKQDFLEYEYIHSIEVIPSTYLRPQGGFSNLKQVANAFDVEVMALVSYDQVRKSYYRDSSLLYLTLVGAYVFKGDANEVDTFVDTVIFDVKTESMLLRAPGLSSNTLNSTAMAQDKVLNTLSERGFVSAVDDMSEKLKAELEVFKVKVEAGEKVKVSYRDGYSGGGSIGLIMLLLLAGLIVMNYRHKAKC